MCVARFVVAGKAIRRLLDRVSLPLTKAAAFGAGTIADDEDGPAELDAPLEESR